MAVQDPANEGLINLLLEHSRKEDSWVVASNGIIYPLHEIPEKHPQWLNSFIDTYLFLIHKDGQVVARSCAYYIWELINNRHFACSSASG